MSRSGSEENTSPKLQHEKNSGFLPGSGAALRVVNAYLLKNILWIYLLFNTILIFS